MSVVKTEHGLMETIGTDLRARAKSLAYLASDTLATHRLNAAVAYVTQDLRSRFTTLHKGLRRQVVHNGIGTLDRADTSRPVAYAPEQRNVLLLGRLESVKGIEFALRALSIPGTPGDIHLHIVGDGPAREDLVTLSQQLQVRPRVHFHGFRTDVNDFLAHADLLLMPSLHEGLPYTLLEALAFHIPVIASDVGGLREVLEHDKTALLIPSKDPSAISHALHRLFAEPGLRERIARAGGELVSGRLSADAMGRTYLALYRTMQ